MRFGSSVLDLGRRRSSSSPKTSRVVWLMRAEHCLPLWSLALVTSFVRFPALPPGLDLNLNPQLKLYPNRSSGSHVMSRRLGAFLPSLDEWSAGVGFGSPGMSRCKQPKTMQSKRQSTARYNNIATINNIIINNNSCGKGNYNHNTATATATCICPSVHTYIQIQGTYIQTDARTDRQTDMHHATRMHAYMQTCMDICLSVHVSVYITWPICCFTLIYIYIYICVKICA